MDNIINKIICNKCNGTSAFITKTNTQTGLYCSKCGKWIKWLGKEELRLYERKLELNKIEEEEWNIIKVPCKTGDIIWFVDNEYRYIYWGKVLAFTETDIIVDTCITEYKRDKKHLPISEWNKTIVLTKIREEAENKLSRK